MYFHGVLEFVRQSCPSSSKVAIVHSTAGAFPKDVASGAVEQAPALGFDTVRAHTYNAGTTDFGRILNRLKRDRPDVVLAVGRIEDDIRFAQQFVESKVSVPVVALIVTPLALFKDSLGESVEGFLGPSQWEPDAVTIPDFGPSSRDVVWSLRANRQSAVDYPMAQAYAGCLVAQHCVDEAGSLDQRAVRQIASSMDFTTFYGRFVIDPRHGASDRPPDARGAVGAWEEGRGLATGRGVRAGSARIGPMICSSCGHQNRPRAEFCAACGENLAHSDGVCTACGTSNPSGKPLL